MVVLSVAKNLCWLTWGCFVKKPKRDPGVVLDVADLLRLLPVISGLFCLLTERALGVVLSVDLACPWGRFIGCWLPVAATNFSR